MTLYKVIDLIKILALKHPNVNSAEEGDIYSILNANQEQKYAKIVLTQDTHTEDEVFDNYNLNIFYVDRLFSDIETNRLDIQSTAKNVLSNIIRAFCEEFDAECNTINYHTFTERFIDECAGAYAAITISIPKSINCTEKYWDESWTSPLISTVVRNQNKSVEFKENGTYTIEYDAEKYTGLGKVSVEVNVPDINGSYDDGYSDGYDVGKEESYEEGKEDGIKEGYTKGYNEGNLEGYNQGKTEGYQEGKTDGIEEGYTDGKEDGIEEGYSQGKSDGFNEGKAEGYTEGKTDGISQQKAKLEGVIIRENGTYTKEDGYNNIVVEVADTNGSYDEGYDDGYEKGKDDGIEEGTSNAGSIIAETAQVLNITENGIYTTKYSKESEKPITGYFDDGTPFYNYALLTEQVYTLSGKKDYRVELWWKPNYGWTTSSTSDAASKYPYGIISCNIFRFGISDDGKSFQLDVTNTNETLIETITKEGVLDKWYHFIISSDEGVFIDGEKIYEPIKTNVASFPFRLNNSYSTVYKRYANGYYGMVKFDDKIYIPTENDFVNYATNEPLTIYTKKTYVFNEYTPLDGNLIRTVNVNVIPKIKLADINLKFAYSDIKEVPEWADFEGITTCQHLFRNCGYLLSVPYFDTSNVTDMQYAFAYCSKLTTIPQLETSKVTNLNFIFNGCSSLVSIPAIYVGNVTSITQPFGSSNLTNLTDFGGFIDLKRSLNDNYGFVRCPNLSYQSCINVLNGLYDFTGNGVTPTSSEGKLKVSQSFMDKLSEEDLQIATGKGWQLLV